MKIVRHKQELTPGQVVTVLPIKDIDGWDSYYKYSGMTFTIVDYNTWCKVQELDEVLPNAIFKEYLEIEIPESPYRCDYCGNEYDEELPFSVFSESARVCPHCDSTNKTYAAIGR